MITINFIAWMIVACEIGFWIVIVCGMVSRYVFKNEKASMLFFVSVPLIDLLLLVIAGISLFNGADPTMAHAIAAVYLGVSIAFGKDMIAWLDARFLYFVMRQGERPVKRYGMDFAKHYLRGWLKHLLAFLIGAALLFGMIYIARVQGQGNISPFYDVLKLWLLIMGIDLIITISYFIWPKGKKSL